MDKSPSNRPRVATIALLLVLYIIQAVPMGICSGLPLSLQGRGATYSDLAKFSVASLPFTLKLLWAPIVDTTSLPNHGRRKSWLIPVQLLCALLMALPPLFGGLPSLWAGEHPEVSPIRIIPLTVYFFVLYLLMATQDIAVDGWALEILPPEYKKHASTCNTIGQSLGFYVTNIMFLLFNHTKRGAAVHSSHSNWLLASVRSVNISLNAFLQFWGIMIAVVTLYVAFFVPEDQVISAEQMSQNDGVELKGVKSSYESLGSMIKLPAVQLAALLLLTCRLPFGPLDSSGTLKIIESGCAKEILALLAPAGFPIGLAASYLTGHWINKRFSALVAFQYGYVMRLVLYFGWLGIYMVSRSLRCGEEHGAWFIYGSIVVGICLQAVCSEIMFVSQMAFFAQVSDVTMGGTYMTFFNTLSNLGNKWPSLLCLSVMDYPARFFSETFIELSLFGTALGFLFVWPLGTPLLRYLERIRASEWHLNHEDRSEEAIELIKVRLLPDEAPFLPSLVTNKNLSLDLSKGH